jgi:16S rRNA processing protein RimM
MALESGSAPARAAEVSAPDEWVWLARIRHPQGRKGELFADLLTDFPQKFADRKQLWLMIDPSAPKPANPATASMKVKGTGFSPYIKTAKSTGALAPEGTGSPREVELINHWPHKGGIVLHFAGIDSISAAETLNGLIVAIPRAERAPLAEDEFYIGDLIGCALIDVAPAEPVVVGIIDNVDRTAGPVALLEVLGASGEVLVPFAKSFLRKIDLEAKRVEMALPEGLVELNAPGK